MRAALRRGIGGRLFMLLLSTVLTAATGAAAVSMPGVQAAQSVLAVQSAAAPVEEARLLAVLRPQVDRLIDLGDEAPARALQALQRLQREHAATPAAQVVVARGIGVVEARAGHPVPAAESARQLADRAARGPDRAASAGAALVRAEVAFNAGQADVAAGFAEQSLAATLGGCPAGLLTAEPRALPDPSAVPGCDWRVAWGAKRLLEHQAEGAGLNTAATAQAQSSLRLVEWAGDARRQCIALMSLARFAEARGERDLADRTLRQARRVSAGVSAGVLTGATKGATKETAAAEAPVDAALAVQLDAAEAGLLAQRGDLDAALRLTRRAVALAARAGLPRAESQLLTNLADIDLRLQRPAEALRAAERGLVIVRSRHDLRAERTLINNAGIAKIGLGRIAEGRQDLARLQDLWHSSGDTGREVETLREFGEALAAAGEPREALLLYHRERALSDELMQANRRLALADLQARNEAQARQRDIELLARENALQTEALANRGLLQAIWALLAAVALLALGIVLMRFRRVRRTHGRLTASQAALRTQSERDPLTGLSNRRHFDAVMARLAAGPAGLHGALLLVDIDHFKAVNDAHGHAVGDQVLVEVARRLVAAVRPVDLVVRWGGEEFLILAPHASAEQAAQMAARVLQNVGAIPFIVGATPVSVGAGRALPVTVSIGHAAYPLPPRRAPMPWQAAVQQTDQALLAAKQRGRNRAVGIESTSLGASESRLASPAGFTAAWRDGQVELRVTAGPVQRQGDLQSA